jgi:hypothetical protein
MSECIKAAPPSLGVISLGSHKAGVGGADCKVDIYAPSL